MTDRTADETRRDFLKLATITGGAALAAARMRPLYAQASAGTGGTFDYLVAGGGHNGLICAAYLAKAGYSVAVLEAKDRAGGNTTTEEQLIPGFLIEPCANTPNGLRVNRAYHELEMTDYGAEFVAASGAADGDSPAGSLVQFYDGEQLVLWEDPDRRAKEIARFSRRDAAAYQTLRAECLRVGREILEWKDTPIGYGPSLAERCAKLPDGALWIKRMRQSAFDIVNEYFEDEHIRSWGMSTVRPFRIPPTYFGTGLTFVQRWAGLSGGGTMIGGAGAIPDSLERILGEHDCPVLTKKFVIELIVENGRCAGAVTADGDVYRARRGVVSSAHVQQLLTMLPGDTLPEGFAASLKRWRPCPLAMNTTLVALKEAPQWNVGGEWIATEGDLIGSVEDELQADQDGRMGRLSTRPTILTGVSTISDPGRALNGGHTMRWSALHPYDLADGGPAKWDEIKHEHSDRELAYLRQFTRGLEAENIIGTYVLSPLDVAGRNINNVGGSCHGGAETIDQMGEFRPVYGWASHRMPLPGLYLTGCSSHPGGSVTGSPGRNAAWIVLEDEGKTIEGVLGDKARLGENREKYLRRGVPGAH
jgi:phytoene dehydrogenase-like protein